jgi:ferredoxin
MFLTKIEGGYFVEVFSKKGDDLLELGDFLQGTDAQKDEADAVNLAADQNCPESLKNSSSEIKHKVRMFYDSKIWEETSEGCFSCGSCNLVCPTCYCFDIQDEWGLGKNDGCRYRRWDACLTREFSEVSVQGGTENFREREAERFRHRILRKTAFLNDKLGAPACVGCGRCSGACTANIANPVSIINKIMES